MHDNHTVFLMFERGVQAIVPRGTRKCRKAMWKMDRAFTEEALPTPVVSLREINDVARMLLRARCAVCTKRCREPLNPFMTRAVGE